MVTQELYDELLKTPDIHSYPELDGKKLIRKLYDNAYIHAYCDGYDTYTGIISCPLTH